MRFNVQESEVPSSRATSNGSGLKPANENLAESAASRPAELMF